jgi:hypothetical protein
MFKLSVPATRPTPFTFRKVRAFLGVFSVRVIDIFAVRKKFKIVQMVVGAVKVFVVNLKPTRYFAVKRFPNQTMNGTPQINAVAAQINRKVMLYRLRSQRSVCFIATPSLAIFNGRRGRNAGVQERGYFNQFATGGQHFLGLNNLFSRKPLSARNPAHVSKIADFVQRFVSKHGLPLFHNISPLTFRYGMPNLIKGQA